MIDLSPYVKTVERLHPVQWHGRVTRITGLLIETNGPYVPLGGLCEIHPAGGGPLLAEAVGFRDRKILLMPYGESTGIGPGDRVTRRSAAATISLGPQLLGRVLDGFARAVDDGPPLAPGRTYPLHAPPPDALSRRRISEPLDLGVRAINGLLTCGKGQRVGILAGSGVGKSVLLGMIARYARADVNVIALIGERGREVREFIEKDLGPHGLQRSVVVVATSDQSPLLRIRAAYAATALAEYFRDQGKDVNLMMDSITRFAMALREVGLSVGEPPTTKGYTPSVFAVLPKLLERAGTGGGKGSVTGLYTVLVEGDDMNEPIADATRAILDGHIVLCRDLAARGHYPAIDVLRSKSRVMIDIVSQQHRRHAERFVKCLATYRSAEDLINIGAYAPGSNPEIDDAIENFAPMNAYLQQAIGEQVSLDESVADLGAVAASPGEARMPGTRQEMSSQ